MKLQLISSLILATSLASVALADKLEDPVRSLKPGQQIRVTEIDAFSRYLEAKTIQQAEDWRQKALAVSRATGEAASSEADFDTLVEAMNLRAGTRVLKDEFLASLSDTRVSSLLDEARRRESPSVGIAEARLIVSQSILNRPGLKERHGDAALERASMIFVTSGDIEAAKRAFQEVSAFHPDAPTLERATASVSALTEPTTAVDYVQAIELLNTSSQFWARRPSAWVAFRISLQFDKHGLEHFYPDRFSGDPRPLKAASRVAFEVGRLPDSIKILEAAEAQQLDVNTTTEIRYWTAMSLHSAGRYAASVDLFEKNIRSGLRSRWVALSTYRAGESCLMNRDIVNAAVYFLEVREGFSQEVDLYDKSVEYSKSIREHPDFKSDEFESALAIRRSARDIADSSATKKGSF